jgi:hypothetical protein
MKFYPKAKLQRWNIFQLKSGHIDSLRVPDPYVDIQSTTTKHKFARVIMNSGSMF